MFINSRQGKIRYQPITVLQLSNPIHEIIKGVKQAIQLGNNGSAYCKNMSLLGMESATTETMTSGNINFFNIGENYFSKNCANDLKCRKFYRGACSSNVRYAPDAAKAFSPCQRHKTSTASVTWLHPRKPTKQPITTADSKPK